MNKGREVSGNDWNLETSCVLQEGGFLLTTKKPNAAMTEENLEERYERYRSILKDLTIMSDVFMRNVLKQRACTEYVLQVIMDRKDLWVVDQVLQKDYKNLQGRSAILDCVVRDADGNQFDVEIQQEKEGASPRRARYHSGLMDMNTLNPGENFEKLPETYVIFITRKDVLGYELPIYHIGRSIKENDEDFKDGSHIIYVNSANREDTELGKLMHDLNCKNATDMYNKILAKRVYELKETQEGVELMCKEMDQIYLEGEACGEKRGEMKKAFEIAITLFEMGEPVERIAQAVKVSTELVQEWLSGNGNLESLNI